MTVDQEPWSVWANNLRRYGLAELVAWLIAAGKPLNILLSQLATIAEPLFTSGNSTHPLNKLITMLEDPEKLEAFSNALVDGGSNQ